MAPCEIHLRMPSRVLFLTPAIRAVSSTMQLKTLRVGGSGVRAAASGLGRGGNWPRRIVGGCERERARASGGGGRQRWAPGGRVRSGQVRTGQESESSLWAQSEGGQAGRRARVGDCGSGSGSGRAGAAAAQIMGCVSRMSQGVGVGIVGMRVGRGAAREGVASITRRMFGRRGGQGTRTREREREREERESEGPSPAEVLSPTPAAAMTRLPAGPQAHITTFAHVESTLE